MTKCTSGLYSQVHQPVLTGFPLQRMDKAIEKFPHYFTIVINNQWEFVRFFDKMLSYSAQLLRSVTPAKNSCFVSFYQILNVAHDYIKYHYIYDCGKFPTENIILSCCISMKAIKLLHF